MEVSLGAAPLAATGDDRDALLATFLHCDGVPTSWTRDTPLQEWEGVQVDEAGHATTLDVSFRRMSGTLNLAMLPQYLKKVSVNGNRFCGTPGLTKLPHGLVELSSLHENKFQRFESPRCDEIQQWSVSLAFATQHFSICLMVFAVFVFSANFNGQFGAAITCFLSGCLATRLYTFCRSANPSMGWMWISFLVFEVPLCPSALALAHFCFLSSKQLEQMIQNSPCGVFFFMLGVAGSAFLRSSNAPRRICRLFRRSVTNALFVLLICAILVEITVRLFWSRMPLTAHIHVAAFATMAVVAAGVFLFMSFATDDDVWRQTLVTALACTYLCVESSHCSDRTLPGYGFSLELVCALSMALTYICGVVLFEVKCIEEIAGSHPLQKGCGVGSCDCFV